MKIIRAVLFSSKSSIVLLILLAVAMGTGTIVEDKYDTVTARAFIYNTIWFELLFVLLAINFIAHINMFHMLRKERLGGVLFHSAFVIMIIGAGITRYFSYEGMMHIREGESSNILYTSEPYLRINVTDANKTYSRDFLKTFDPYSHNSFKTQITSDPNQEIEVRYTGYIKNASEEINENVDGGKDLLVLVVGTDNGKENVFIEDKETKTIQGLTVSFNGTNITDGFRVKNREHSLQFTSSSDVTESNMDEQTNIVLPKDSLYEFKSNCLYKANDVLFMFSRCYKHAKKIILPSAKAETGLDALSFTLSKGNKTYLAPILFAPGQNASYTDFNFDGLHLKIGYGKKPMELPFSVHLNHFILERYAGSESPSSYASEVTVLDPRNNIKKNHRIFMNNVLDYDNFRFFQSSFDQDEKGTILSVNHDFWGTWISYAGYMVLTLGFILTLFNPASRFQILRRSITDVRNKRKSMLTTVAILAASFSAFSQNNVHPCVDKDHADKLGHLVTQTINGRFEPVNSLAYDVLHKITRKDKFNLEGKGQMDAMQVFTDMIIDPEYWKQQKIVYIKEQSVRDLLGLDSKAASFNDFFDAKGKYKLQSYAETSFRKKPAEQNNFDKEIIKVDERANIFMMVFQASILKIFPEPDSPSNTWTSWDEKGAHIALQGPIKIINEDLQLPVLNYNSLMQEYLTQVEQGVKSGNYLKADKIIGYISTLQRQGSAANLLPSEKRIAAEIFYNKTDIFIFLRNCYSVLSLVMLILAFADNVRTTKSKIITTLLNVCIVLLAAGFIYQTFGMCLRAYILGYAPWSNGYEALLLVAWGTLLAGFSFVRYSKITLATTALLAFFTLMTASHSSYDPQLTILSPVLKSYWLIIHVAVLTISYGFLGLGFILGLMNLFIYLFKTQKNHKRLDLLILELTHINEMNLTVGIVLATIGTFLGGVWANESWGRYWGWDAKETWALIIIITYTLLLHLRLIPGMKSAYLFNVASVVSFGSVLMTFFGVNYFLSKGMHSYGAGDHAIFPIWAWIAIASLFGLMIAAKLRENRIDRDLDMETD